MKGDERVQTVEERADSALLCKRWSENLLHKNLRLLFYNYSIILSATLIVALIRSDITFS